MFKVKILSREDAQDKKVSPETADQLTNLIINPEDIFNSGYAPELKKIPEGKKVEFTKTGKVSFTYTTTTTVEIEKVFF